MTELNPRLLSIVGPNKSNVVLHPTHKAHGLYHTRQFVLRLSPEIHRSLGAFESGITTAGQAGSEGMQAMSTFLHETIHWWQHIGSTFGFVYGLNYPVQSHVAYQDLLKLAERDGFKKSVFKRIVELGPDALSNPDTIAGLVNRIINNHFDVMAFQAFSFGPSSAEKIVRDHRFESVGHSFGMTYGHTLNVLRSTVDKCSDLLPDPRLLHEGLRDLTARRVQGFYYESPVQLWPLGAFEILEGQARFSQIQYLSHGSGQSLKWQDFSRSGMLRGVYIAAFKEFLRLTESDWPDTVDDRVSKNSERLFERHGALFVDKELDDGVFPRAQQGRNEETVQSVFNDFYYNTVVYDLINQWISEPGPFKYDVSWLTTTCSTAEAETFLNQQFKSVFGLDPRDVEIIA